MKSKFPTEAKVGIFVVATVLGLLYLTTRINHSGLSLNDSRTLYVEFDNASGLLAKTPVEFAGIRVGYVQVIDLMNRKARAQILLDVNVPVYEDSSVRMENRGLLGEKIISIMGGGRAPLVPDGGTIEAENIGGFHDAIDNFNDIATSVKELIQGGDGKPSLKDIIENVNDTTEDLRHLVRGNRDRMGNIIKNVDELSQTLNGDDLRRTVENLRVTTDSIRNFMGDGGQGSGADDVMQKFKSVMTTLDSTTGRLDRILAKVERGEGTVGRLLSDESTADKIDETLDGINEFVGTVKRIELAVGFRGEYLGDAKEVQSITSFKITPSHDKYFLFEFTDGPIELSQPTITETTSSPPGSTIRETVRRNKFMFTALFARRFYDITLKAGLMRSSGGFGAEYHLFRDHLSFGVDAFDFSRDENMHLRAYAKLRLFKVVRLYGGVDDVIQANGTRNYFGGAGLMLTDNDLKSLFSLAPLVAK